MKKQENKRVRLLKGRVVLLKDRDQDGQRLKVPHMGWNELTFHQPSPLFDGVPEGFAYFVHSYYVSGMNPEDLLASAPYGVQVPAVVGKGNVFGTQFHPEKQYNRNGTAETVYSISKRTEGEQMSDFTLYPAIDMRNGKCVRLVQGDYDQETIYGDSPLDMARRFANEGAKWIHLVDLDGAKAGKRVNHEHVLAIASSLDVNVQIGGGIRTEEDVAFYLNNGVSRVILGSSAVSNPIFRKNAGAIWREIAIGIDARNGFVSTEGWLETSEVKAEELGKELANEGAEVFIFTDIQMDGMLSGPNVESTVRLAEATGKQVIASGGVSAVGDLQKLSAQKQTGVSGAIIGKALYTKQFTLAEAFEGLDSI